MERELHVYLDLDNHAVQVGKLWAYVKSGRQTSLFVYEKSWLKDKNNFPLSPSLALSPGPFHSEMPVHRVFQDTAPDTWGMELMRYDERIKSKKEGVQPKTLFGIDFLTGVSDESRMGALRFKDPETDTFMTVGGHAVPKLIELGKLLSATDRIDKGRARPADVAMVLKPGSALGGARPKAVVKDNSGKLLIAKFLSSNDNWPVIPWEAVTLKLAERSKINVPTWQFTKAAAKPVLLIDRFDRSAAFGRVPYMSAMTALDAEDHGPKRSYLEMVDVLRRYGGSPDEDLRELWRRMLFNVLVSNTDDHLRNHGFLRERNGWRLSPAFDMNPCPPDVRPRIHELFLDDSDATASLDTLFSIVSYFGIEESVAVEMMGEVAAAISDWKRVAKEFGLDGHQVAYMKYAFEHDDLKEALLHKNPKVSGSRKAKKTTPKKTRKSRPKKQRTTKKNTATPRTQKQPC